VPNRNYFYEKITKDEREYLDDILAPMTQHLSQPEMSLIHREYEVTRAQLTDIQPMLSPICAGWSHETPVYGCQMRASKVHWLIPWPELRTRGIPNSLRADWEFLAHLCPPCHILAYSEKQRRLTSWVNLVAQLEHRSPAKVRPKWGQALSTLESLLAPNMVRAQSRLTRLLSRVQYIEITVGQESSHLRGQVTNVNLVHFRTQGTILVSVWSPE
jgi:hypothetical protein